MYDINDRLIAKAITLNAFIIIAHDDKEKLTQKLINQSSLNFVISDTNDQLPSLCIKRSPKTIINQFVNSRATIKINKLDAIP